MRASTEDYDNFMRSQPAPGLLVAGYTAGTILFACLEPPPDYIIRQHHLHHDHLTRVGAARVFMVLALVTLEYSTSPFVF